MCMAHLVFRHDEMMIGMTVSSGLIKYEYAMAGDMFLLLFSYEPIPLRQTVKVIGLLS
jgi:hypothetical protein